MTTQRKKVLLLVPALISGGAQRVFSTLLRHLDRDRFEIHLAVLKADGAFMAEVPADVAIHDLKVSRIRYAVPSIVRVTRRVRPDTILSTLVYMNLDVLAAKPFLPAGTRILVRESTMASTFLAEETNHPAMWKWAYRHLYPRADRIICLSDAMIEDLVEHFGVPREKLVRIYNPVDTEMVRRSADAQANPYVGAGPHLVTAGRLAREKGIDILLDAMPAVLAALPGARLHVLGEGPEEAALQAQAKALGVPEQVEFLGFRQNPWPHLKHADLFILPSRYEGLPNALLEALALGTPAVAAACPGAIQEIRDVTGKIDMVPAEDAGGLAQAIVTACQRAKGGGERSSGAEDGLGRFSLQQAVEEYSALL